MKRVPVFATVVVVAAVAAMIGLGVWQLNRAEWKARLLAEYAANAAMPALDLDPLLAREPARMPPLAYRRVLVTCRSEGARPDLRGGQSRVGQSGYSYFLPCRPGARGLAGRLRVNAGWSRMPDDSLRPSLSGTVAGRLGAVTPDEPVTLTSAQARPPLEPSAAPGIETIPNNHLFYAFQWFFFAAAAAVIYLLALRGRRREKLPPDGPDPKSSRA